MSVVVQKLLTVASYNQSRQEYRYNVIRATSYFVEIKNIWQNQININNNCS